MKSVIPIFLLVFLLSCGNEKTRIKIDDAYAALDSSYVEFRAGTNEIAKNLAKEAFSVGLELENDSLTGDALMSLCRTALRDRDEITLKDYSDQLTKLANKSKDDTWEMVSAHMNAEMARMNHNWEKASRLYDKSLTISDSLGYRGMYAAEHFNKSFVEAARGNITEAQLLTKKYFDIRRETNPESDDAYGLIAVANLLYHKNDIQGSAEVSLAARRLFNERNIIPDPADEEPLLKVEEHYKMKLDPKVQDSLKESAAMLTVDSILNKYLEE